MKTVNRTIWFSLEANKTFTRDNLKFLQWNSPGLENKILELFLVVTKENIDLVLSKSRIVKNVFYMKNTLLQQKQKQAVIMGLLSLQRRR